MAVKALDLAPFHLFLEPFADLDGIVPQADDDWQDFRWPGNYEWTDSTWKAFTEQSTLLLREAAFSLARS